MNGPAHLDIHAGLAHKDPLCPAFVDAVATAIADDGEMTGFLWCGVCGSREFIEEACDGATDHGDVSAVDEQDAQEGRQEGEG